MDSIESWTGRSACVLQAALRLTNELFARRLGVAIRTVGVWHQKPDIVPKHEMQQLLDTLLEKSPESVRSRFWSLMSEVAPESPQRQSVTTDSLALTVAIAIVTDGARVLVVQRRGEDGAGISWQFPAGMVKPGGSSEQVAIRETFGETGVHCSVARSLGSRVHPITHVYCEYFLCEYLTGEPQNMDLVENVSVTWVNANDLTRFIPEDSIFPPVLEALEVSDGSGDS